MTLSELKTLIQNYVENTETTFVNTLDDFIKTLPNMHIFFKDTMNDKHMVIGCLE